MKKLCAIAILALLVIAAGCSNSELTTVEAKKIILETFPYPEQVNKQIFCGDMNQAKRLLDLGFEKDGWVIITKTKTATELRKPWIAFTAKSDPYLLPTPEEEAKYKRQNIKVGEIHFVDVAGIVMDKDGKSAMVSYTTQYKNLTPFAKFFKFDFSKQIENKAYFIKYDTGWKIEQQPGPLTPPI